MANLETRLNNSQDNSRNQQENAVLSTLNGPELAAFYRVPKIPLFLHADPILWFVQVEATLNNARISDEGTRVDFLITALDSEAMLFVRDLLLQVPRPSGIFAQIKARLIRSFAMSDESKLRRLLKGQVEGEGKPSIMLGRLRSLAPEICNGNSAILKQVFLDQLPPAHRDILIASGMDDLEKMANVADKLAESSPDQGICSVQQESETWEKAYKKLEEKIDSMSMKLNSRGRSRSKFRSDRSPKSRGQAEGDRKSSLCYAHRRYPDSPRSCKPYCEKFEKFHSKN